MERSIDSEVKSFEGIRMCFVPHKDCKDLCKDYLECPKYQRDELEYNSKSD